MQVFNIYLAGSTTSPDLPSTTGAFQPRSTAPRQRRMSTSSKLRLPGSVRIRPWSDYLTYLGSSGTDVPVGIRVDVADNAYIAGTTTSACSHQHRSLGLFSHHRHQCLSGISGKPGHPRLRHRIGLRRHALPYSTYLSGNGTDTASGMTIDASGNVYLTGTTTSTDASSATDQFPASFLPQGQAFQSASRAPGLAQFFVTKVNTISFKSNSIAYSTYFGGGVFGTTPLRWPPAAALPSITLASSISPELQISSTPEPRSATDFPILNPYQPCLGQAPPATLPIRRCVLRLASVTLPDAFVAKLNLNINVSPGQQLIWSTYLGGSGSDSSAGVAVDTGAANVYVVGTTNSTDIGTTVSTRE